jgi:hemolysin III
MSVLVSRGNGETDFAIVPTDGRPPGLTWNYDRREMLADAVVHAVAVALALGAATHLAITAGTLATLPECASLLIYAIALIGMFGISAVYNLWPVCPRKWLLRRFDQSAIYLMIAAGYTPFLVRARAETLSIAFLVGVWLAAAAGIALKLVAPARCDRRSVVLYLLLGWTGALALTVAGRVLPASTLALIAAGGIVYSAGVIFYFWERLRYQHAIWHGFVLAGTACQYSAVLDCLPRAVAG